eukprot:8161944-Heterocapsa_arctica.AAC.1
MFAEVAEKKDDYKKFHEQFGKCLGPVDEYAVWLNMVKGVVIKKNWVLNILEIFAEIAEKKDDYK